jgi:hypothetical protein
LPLQQILNPTWRSPGQSYDFCYQLKSESMLDFLTSDIWHFTGPNQILSVLSDEPTNTLSEDCKI